MAIQHHYHECGCVITTYGDGSAPDIEYCDDHTSLRRPEEEIFRLARGGESSRAKAADLVRKLPPQARRDLRAACQRLDNLIDDVWLEELRERRIAKTKGD